MDDPFLIVCFIGLGTLGAMVMGTALAAIWRVLRVLWIIARAQGVFDDPPQRWEK